MHSKTLVIIIFTILLLWSFSIFHSIEISRATGSFFYVGGAGPGNYTTIQDAINAASSGDEVYVFSGTYYENIVIDKDLTLTGQNKDNTIIDGNKNGRVVYVYKGEYDWIECFISGFTIRNAGGSGNDCISMSYLDNGIIENNNILNSDLSSGIQLDHCNDITISDNTIANNDQETGIHLIVSSDNTIFNNLIQENSRGFYIDYSSNNYIYNNDITRNNYGVTVLSTSSNNYFYLNDFTNNNILNAQDSGTNSWNYNDEGNYWDDYGSIDSDEDGIGDTPYDILPSGANKDNFPLGYFVDPIPTAYIDEITPNPAIEGETITFYGHGLDDETIIYWMWTSNLVSGVLSPAASFQTSTLPVGVHTITFKVQDNELQWSDPVEEILIVNSQSSQEDNVPTAYITSIEPNPAAQGQPISFNGRGSDDGSITEYRWREGDTILAASPSFTKSDFSVGSHTIYFRVKDDNNQWSPEVSEHLIITSGSSTENQHPIAIAGGPYIASVNSSIFFNASDSYDPDGEIISYIWDFGDGYSGSDVTVNHTYSTPGNYTVTLIVTDNFGLQTTHTTTVTIGFSSGTDDQSGTGSNILTDFLENIPIQLLAPILGLIIFLTILAAFFLWMKRS